MAEIKKKLGGRPSKKPSNEELARLYEFMTARQIAEHYEVPVATVRSWIARARKDSE